MRYFKFVVSTPYCDTEEEEYLAFPDSVTEEELAEYAEEKAHNQDGSFMYLIFGWYVDCHCEYIEVSEEEFIENGGVDA